MSATGVGLRQKNLKKILWLTSSRKTRLGPKYKLFIIGIFFLKILFRAYNFLYSSTRPVDKTRVFFNFRFSCRKSASRKELAKKITHFTIQFCLKNLTRFTNLNSLDIDICSRNTAENLSHFTNFPENMFLFGVGKNHLYCTIT